MDVYVSNENYSVDFLKTKRNLTSIMVNILVHWTYKK